MSASSNVRDLLALLSSSQSQLPQARDRVSIHRGLDGLQEHSSRLFAATRPYRGDQEARLDTMLARHGFDNERHRRTMHLVTTRAAMQETQPHVHPRDIQSYLKRRHHMLMLQAVDEAQSRTNQELQNACLDTLNSEWTQTKDELEQLLGRRKGQSLAALAPSSSMQQAVTPIAQPGFGAQQPAHHHRHATEHDARQAAYATVVVDVAEQYKSGKYSNRDIADDFLQSVKSSQDQRDRKLLIQECWELVSHVSKATATPLTVGASSSSSSSSAIVPMETEDNILGDGKAAWNHALRIVTGSRSFLEAGYESYIKASVASPPHSHIKDVDNANWFQIMTEYVRLSFARGDSDYPQHLTGIVHHNDGNGPALVYPVWPCIYYSFRSGKYEDALAFANATPHVDPIVTEAIRAYAMATDRQTHVASHQLQTKYSEIKDSKDPYLVAVYLILTRNEVGKVIDQLAKTAQDFMWWKLCYIRFMNERHLSSGNASTVSNIASQMTLENLQNQLLQCGAEYFRCEADPLLWFKMLCMCGLFELAIHHILLETKYQVEAVHFALALHYRSLLRVPQQLDEPLLSNNKPRHEINVHCIIHEYCRWISPQHPDVAVCYYHLLRNEAVMELALIELAVDNKLSEQLFGSIAPNGQRTRACVERVLPEKFTNLVVNAAAVAQRKGRYSTMLELYLIAEHRIVEQKNSHSNSAVPQQFAHGFMQTVFNVLNPLLSQAVQMGSPNREEYLQLANRMQQHLQSGTMVTSNVALNTPIQTFFTLLNLAKFFQLAQQQQYQAALELSKELGILPFEQSDINAKVAAFQERCDDCVRHNLPCLVVEVMRALLALKNQTAQKQRLQEIARCILQFAGRGKFGMTNAEYSELLSLGDSVSQ